MIPFFPFKDRNQDFRYWSSSTVQLFECHQPESVWRSFHDNAKNGTNTSFCTDRPLAEYWEPQELCTLSSQFLLYYQESDIFVLYGETLVGFHSSSTHQIRIAVNGNGGFRTFDHTLASYMTAPSQKMTKITFESIFSAQSSTLSFLTHYLQVRQCVARSWESTKENPTYCLER